MVRQLKRLLPLEAGLVAMLAAAQPMLESLVLEPAPARPELELLERVQPAPVREPEGQEEEAIPEEVGELQP